MKVRTAFFLLASSLLAASATALAIETQINLPTQQAQPAPAGGETYYHAIPATPAVGQAVKIVDSKDDTDYVVKVFKLRNPNTAYELAILLRPVIDAENGKIKTTLNAETDEGFIVVTAPIFQMEYIERAVEILDKKGLSNSDDNMETRVYAFKNRQGGDLQPIIEGALASPYHDLVMDNDLNQVVINDSHSSMGTIFKYLPMFDVPIRQIRIECEIVELENSDDFNFGLALEAWKEALPESVDMTLDWDSSKSSNGDGPSGWARSIAQNIKMSGLRPKAVANFVNYLVRKGYAKVLSRPTIVVANGKEAIVQSTDNVNYRGYNSDPEKTLDKQVETGVILKIKPGLAECSMNLDVDASVNSVTGWTTGGLPVVNTRNTVANVNAVQGETVTISGLKRDYVTKADERVPILGSIPLIGYVFRHEVDVQRSSEIIIMLTPYEVNKDAEKEHAQPEKIVEDLDAKANESEMDRFVRRVILNK